MIRKLFKLPLYVLAIPAVLAIRLIAPWLLVRFGGLISPRIGHFAVNTELYLCERDAGISLPNQFHIDIFYMGGNQICNKQLALMWRRRLRIWPAWIAAPICRINQFFPGGKVHELGQNTQRDRDVHNLMDRFSPHLQFTKMEEYYGQTRLRTMGIPIGAQFVCLNIRDSAYLAAHLSGGNYDYHNYRDCDARNFVLAAEALADRGYFVIRMGAMVKEAINCPHPRVIDYACNGMRSDFMDIFLGAKCTFCITTGSGWDGIPAVFLRPIVYVNFVPLAYLHTFRANSISITKKYVLRSSRRTLNFREILSHGIGFSLNSSDYQSKGVDLIENTPEEIRDVAIEMAERLAGTWQYHSDDEALQQRFWQIFPSGANDENLGNPLHGEIRARFGAAYLRNNVDLLL